MRWYPKNNRAGNLLAAGVGGLAQGFGQAYQENQRYQRALQSLWMQDDMLRRRQEAQQGFQREMAQQQREWQQQDMGQRRAWGIEDERRAMENQKAMNAWQYGETVRRKREEQQREIEAVMNAPGLSDAERQRRTVEVQRKHVGLANLAPQPLQRFNSKQGVMVFDPNTGEAMPVTVPGPQYQPGHGGPPYRPDLREPLMPYERPAAQKAPSTPKTIRQNGGTFQWNAEAGKWEAAPGLPDPTPTPEEREEFFRDEARAFLNKNPGTVLVDRIGPWNVTAGNATLEQKREYINKYAREQMELMQMARSGDPVAAAALQAQQGQQAAPGAQQHGDERIRVAIQAARNGDSSAQRALDARGIQWR